MSEYRFRRGFLGKAVLQRRVSYPSFLNGHIDHSIRDVRWVDVEYDRLPILTVTPWQSPDGMDGDGPAFQTAPNRQTVHASKSLQNIKSRDESGG